MKRASDRSRKKSNDEREIARYGDTMRIGKLVNALATIVLAGSIIQFGERMVFAQGGSAGRTLAADQVTIKQGQTARLEVANRSDESLIVWLFFLDSADKVLIKKDVKIKPGATAALEYSFTGSNNLNGVSRGNGGNAKVLSGNAPLVSGLVLTPVIREEFKTDGSTHPNPGNKPTLRILEKGETVRLIGPEGFKEGKNPKGSNVGDQTEFTELRPGNDPLPPKESTAQGFPIGFSTAAFDNNSVNVVRLTIRSNAQKPLRVILRFVDNNDKVLTYQDTKVSQGHDAMLKYPEAGIGMKAQFGVSDKQSLLLLQPTLEIVDKQNGSIVKTIGQEGFMQIGGAAQP